MGSMSMLNQAAVEALCSATYLENYLDCMESLPDDLQRCVSQLRELDLQTCAHMRDLAHQKAIYKDSNDQNAKKRSLHHIQKALIKCQEIGDEKQVIVSNILDHVENRARYLGQDLENLDPTTSIIPKEKPDSTPSTKVSISGKGSKTPTYSNASTPTHTPSTPTHNVFDEKSDIKILTGKRQRRQRTHHDETMSKDEEKREKDEKPKKKKKRKLKKDKEDEKSPNIEPIDPDEPTYCLCEQVSYGEMIGCDNDNCPIEWFHFNCVRLTHKPKGKWYCPKCRGDKPNIIRPELLK